jgi:hypothetical protein
VDRSVAEELRFASVEAALVAQSASPLFISRCARDTAPEESLWAASREYRNPNTRVRTGHPEGAREADRLKTALSLVCSSQKDAFATDPTATISDPI